MTQMITRTDSARSLPVPAGARALRLALPLAAALVLVAPALQAQGTWVALDTSPAGTPAEVLLDAAASNTVDSFFDVLVHGFWSEFVTPGDGFTYERITVPGLGRIGQEGAPDLPTARMELAVSTDATTLQLVSVVDLAPNVFPGVLPYPFGVQATDEAFDPSYNPGPGFSGGTAEQFVKDPLVYGGTAAFPAASASGSALVRPWLGSVPHAPASLSPAQWSPATGALSVSGHLRVHYSAVGATQAFPAMTKDRAILAAATFANWSEQGFAFPIDVGTFLGRYLIVTPALYLNRLEPFIHHKQLQGFSVDVITLESLAFVGCGEIRGAIDDWYQAGSPWADHYALLVGDSAVLPTCPSPTLSQLPGDDLYGSPADGDLDEEVFVGRISVDGGDDLSFQLAKIMAYDANTTAQHFDEALLLAHAEDAPGWFEGAQESVRTASYAEAPSFETLYGSDPATNHLTVNAAINAGVGVVSYRGHGSETTFAGWTASGADYHKNEILSLSNKNDPMVVWSLSCWNNKLQYELTPGEDSIGESWLERRDHGAVAHYGSTSISGHYQNDELDAALFQAVFDKGISRHGQAIAWAEDRMDAALPGANAWMYLLLGDPSMRVRHTDPVKLVLELPDEIDVCPAGGGGCSISVRVTNTLGQPLAGVLVSAVQTIDAGQQPLFAVSGYTDGNGTATLPGGPGSVASPMLVQGSDPGGNQANGIVGVVDDVWANFGSALPGLLGEPELVGEGPLTAGSPVLLDTTDLAPNEPAALFVSLGSTPVGFKGGILKAAPPWAILDLATDGLGEIHLGTVWPNGIPADTEFWFQVAAADPVAEKGVALSNAVRAITP